MGRKVIKRRELVSEAFSQKRLHPVVERVYRGRGVQDVDALDRSLQRLLPWEQLSGIRQAAERLAQALAEQQSVVIVGDFDTDGATSVALMVRSLRAMGLAGVQYLVPNRFEFGYGLSPEIVDVAHERFRPQLLVTVDNGISSLEGVKRAKALGMDVMITDHHLPPDELPEADFIVNPNLEGDTFPSKVLAGVGVAFYLMLALRATLRASGWFKSQGLDDPNMAQVLDLVALGTVADVVPLDANNRLMVYHGLQRIQRGYACVGIQALMAVSHKDIKRTTAADLSFAVAPRLNAAGRLEDMSLGVACLLCSDPAEADRHADRLNQLNLERRDIEAKMQEKALGVIRDIELDAEGLPLGLVLFSPDWHQGVIGIVASRLKDKFNRPVAVFSQVSETQLKGSVRSIRGLNIRDVLQQVDQLNPGVIAAYGGHAGAAGLSIDVDKLNEFRQAFAEEVAQSVGHKLPEPSMETDGELAPEDMTHEMALALRDAGPWGQGFPEPMFDGVFKIIGQRLVGERHLKFQLQTPCARETLAAIAFNIDLEAWPCLRADQVRVVYRLDISEYRGVESLQMVVQYMEVVSELDPEVLALEQAFAEA